ncbi:MAG: T9SS type A sorting domain-containing protein [Calditrichaeota bacterium]|nr:T9SS type A sorting domain-containing protein [Calditrichota bacterium]MCB9367124.1 T9SS type A sorting domain-containing protein [Calditrichota bacterium]MCB9391896.1 T9SS type A sorting domain-containing protein [Calditrichota bacterium]
MTHKLLSTLLLISWLVATSNATTHHVSIQNFAFTPQSMTIAAGDSVIFTNNDSAPHTATSTTGAFDSGNLNSGASFGTQFAQEGSFAYVCLYHSNMSGVINVGGGQSSDTSWVELDSPTSLPLLDVRFWNADIGWIAGEQGILRTTNGGDSWQLTATSDDAEALYFVSATEGWACGNDGMILHTTNGGQSWTPQNSGVADKLRDIWFADASTGWAVGRDGILIHTTNGGQTWSPQASPATDDLRGIHMLDAQNGWLVGSDGLILHTSNGGANWEIQLSVPIGNEDEFEGVFALDETHAWAVGGQGRIYHLDNANGQWTQQTSGTNVALMDVFFTNTDDGCSCGAGGFLSSAMMGGAMWHTQVPPVVATFNSVFFVNDSLGFLVSGDGRIFRREISEVSSSSPEDHSPVHAAAFELQANYPNPFNPSTTIEFSIPSAGPVTLTIFDVLGQQVAQPLNSSLRAGAHRVEFQADALPSGAYFYQLNSNGLTSTRKMLLLK